MSASIRDEEWGNNCEKIFDENIFIVMLAQKELIFLHREAKKEFVLLSILCKILNSVLNTKNMNSNAEEFILRLNLGIHHTIQIWVNGPWVPFVGCGRKQWEYSPYVPTLMIDWMSKRYATPRTIAVPAHCGDCWSNHNSQRIYDSERTHKNFSEYMVFRQVYRRITNYVRN